MKEENQKESLILSSKKVTTDNVSEQQKYGWLIAFSCLLMLSGFLIDSPSDIVSGMMEIFTSPSNLFTDYIALTCVGAALLNSGMLALLSTLMARSQKMRLSGPVLAAIFTVAGFAFFGKNLFNFLPVAFGVFLYSLWERKPFSQYLIISLFGTALAPVVSYIAFGMGLTFITGIIFGYATGIIVGIVLPPLSIHFMNFHQGFNLYNIGFTAGIVGMMVTAVMRMFGHTVENFAVLSSGNNLSFGIALYTFFLLLFLLGFYYNGFSMKGFKKILKTSGKLATDFILIAGFGNTLMNMALMGIVLTSYVLFVGGQLNGSTIAGIFMAVGFSAYGNHLRNSIPILIGVYIASLLHIYDPTSEIAIIAALFGTTLAPISGYYGAPFGIIAGFFHMSLVSNVGYLHGGLNLYNNGFSGGMIALIMVPLLDNLLHVRKVRKDAREKESAENPK